MTDHVVDLDTVAQKLPKGYKITVVETPDNQWHATISNSGAGVYVSEVDVLPQVAVDRCYERYVATYRR